jgi:hypothetical protein
MGMGEIHTKVLWNLPQQRQDAVLAWQASGQGASVWCNDKEVRTFTNSQGSQTNKPSYQTMMKWNEYKSVTGSSKSAASVKASNSLSDLKAQYIKSLEALVGTLTKKRDTLAAELKQVEADLEVAKAELNQ